LCEDDADVINADIEETEAIAEGRSVA